MRKEICTLIFVKKIYLRFILIVDNKNSIISATATDSLQYISLLSKKIHNNLLLSSASKSFKDVKKLETCSYILKFKIKILSEYINYF